MSRDTRSDGGRRTTRRSVIAAGATAVGTAAFSGAGAASGGGGGTADETAGESALPPGPPEVRGIYAMPLWYWNAPTAATSRAKMGQWLERAVETGLNVVHAWIESDGLASLLGEPAYATHDYYDFWNPERGWDPLGELIAGAHDRGMEVHLWYSFTRYKRSALPIPEYNPDLEVLPPGDPDWASLRKPEYERGYHDSSHPKVGGASLCVNAEGAHDWTLEALARAFERYPGLRGLHIEEPGYLADDRCVCQRCRRIFADRYDTDPGALLEHTYTEVPPYFDDGMAIPVRTRGTDAFVERLHDWWSGRDSADVLSFNGGWRADWDRVLGRNWAEWSERGWVPYYSPQVYVTDLDRFEKMVAETMEALADTVIAPIVAIESGSASNDALAVAEQIRRARSLDGHAGTTVGGASVFSGPALTPDQTGVLRSGPYTRWSPPHWHPSNGTGVVQRGDATIPELREQDPFAFDVHRLEGDRPGDDPVAPVPDDGETDVDATAGPPRGRPI